MRVLSLFLILFGLISSSGCDLNQHDLVPEKANSSKPEENEDQDQRLDYDFVFNNILVPHCISCHRAGGRSDFLDMNFRPEVMSYIKPGDPGASFLYTIIQDGEMPPDAPLDPELISLLEQWILQGAP